MRYPYNPYDNKITYMLNNTTKISKQQAAIKARDMRSAMMHQPENTTCYKTANCGYLLRRLINNKKHNLILWQNEVQNGRIDA